MEYRLNTKKPHWLCLILLISFPSVSTVLISPALPIISDFFQVSNGYAQQLITLFVLGYALGQLLYSPFANRFGRKVAVYLGLSLYFLSSIICLWGIYQHNLNTILLGRFFMALGSSVGMIISFTIINDFYHPKQARSVVSYTVLAYAFMPALAIALGGLITTHWSWIDCFYFFLIYGVVIFFVTLSLPETLQPKNRKALKLKLLAESYSHALSSGRLLLFSFIYGLMSAFIYIIASGAPFIGIDQIGLSSARYGTLLLIPYGGQFIGALLAGNLSRRFSAYLVMGIGYGSAIFGSVFMFLGFCLHWINAFSLMAPLFFIMMGLPMVYSSVTVMALMGYEDKATGSAIMSFITMGISLLATLALTLLPNRNPIVMPSLFLFVLALAILSFWYAYGHFQEGI